MSLKSGKKFSLDEMTAMHEIAPIDETPTVKISAEEWESLARTVEDMQALARSMMTERRNTFTTSRSYLTRMETLSKNQAAHMNELTEKATEIITAESEKQAGKVSESLTSLVAKWEKRQSILWWIQILFAVVPSVLALLSVVLLDWLR